MIPYLPTQMSFEELESLPLPCRLLSVNMYINAWGKKCMIINFIV